MSDLNQLIKAYLENKKDEIKEKILFLIERYKTSKIGPICCFWTGKLEDVKLNGDVNLDFFVESRDHLLIGCSRGFLCFKEREVYLEKLCKECVGEAKKILNGATGI